MDGVTKARIWREDLRNFPVAGWPWFRPCEWHYRDGKFWVDACNFDDLCRGIKEIVCPDIQQSSTKQ